MGCTAMLVVRDVEASSRWYQRLFGLHGAHGGSEFEMLMSGESLELMLYDRRFSQHLGIADPAQGTPGRGVLLYFSVEDVNAVYERAREMGAEIKDQPHENPDAGSVEFSLRDPDGYVLSAGQRSR